MMAKKKGEKKKTVDPRSEFAEAYQKLCKKYALRISAVPMFRLRDDGTWSVVTQTRIEPMKPNR